MKRMKIAVTIMGVLLVLGLTACSSSDSGSAGGITGSAVTADELENMLPEEITSYSLSVPVWKNGVQLSDAKEYEQKVADLKIIRRNTDEDSDDVRCEITLQDKRLKRTVYAEFYLTNYEVGGWQIDSWEPYQEEKAEPLTGPPEKQIENAVSELGYDKVEFVSDDTEELKDGYFYRFYSVDEDDRYVSFQGGFSYYAVLSYTEAKEDTQAEYSWSDNFSNDDLEVNWKITGIWKGEEETEYRPDSFRINIKSFDPYKEKINASGTWHWISTEDEKKTYDIKYIDIKEVNNDNPASAVVDVTFSTGTASNVEIKITKEKAEPVTTSFDGNKWRLTVIAQ